MYRLMRNCELLTSSTLTPLTSVTGPGSVPTESHEVGSTDALKRDERPLTSWFGLGRFPNIERRILRNHLIVKNPRPNGFASALKGPLPPSSFLLTSDSIQPWPAQEDASTVVNPATKLRTARILNPPGSSPLPHGRLSR
jgi:hypothetical protein